MYFLISKKNDIKARLQFSFKYRIFDEEGLYVRNFPFLKKFHLVILKPLWDISASSSPFEDSFKKKIFSRTKGYFQIQLFYGYGETFLNYNKKEEINIRFGYAIV